MKETGSELPSASCIQGQVLALPIVERPTSALESLQYLPVLRFSVVTLVPWWGSLVSLPGMQVLRYLPSDSLQGTFPDLRLRIC